ncbi:MAG: hypothetical protein ABIH25_00340 [Candidatus Woesearchaeota archaeon]
MEKLVTNEKRIDLKYEPAGKLAEIKELTSKANVIEELNYLRTIDYDCDDGNCSD